MNLKLSHVPNILFRGVLGAGFLSLIALFVPEGSLGTFELILTIQQTGLIFGALGGMILSIIVLVIKDSYHPEMGAAANFTSINGTGSRLIGKSDVAADGSYLTTEWFCMLWIPVFPVCTYRVVFLKDQSTLFCKWYIIAGKHPVQAKYLVKGYLRTVAIVSTVTLAALFLKWIEP